MADVFGRMKTSNVTQLVPVVQQRVRDIYKNVLRLRIGDSREHLVLMGDSIADWEVFGIMAQEAQKQGVKVSIIYYLTNEYDSVTMAESRLNVFAEMKIKVKVISVLTDASEVMEVAVNQYAAMGASIGITNIADDYDLRQRLNDYSVEHGISLLELPTIDMIAFTSAMFSADLDRLRVEGNNIRDLLGAYSRFKLLAGDGMDLELVVNRRFINEADNDFSGRHWDVAEDGEMAALAVQDNFPGEVYTNIREARGHMVLYQLDNDVAKYILRDRNLIDEVIEDKDYYRIIYDGNDPIHFDVENNKVVLESITSENGFRGRMLKRYLSQKMIDDSKYATRPTDPEASLRLIEWAIGTNPGAKNPEETIGGMVIDSTLITEKALGIWHIAFGNSPCPDIPQYTNLSASHIDCGIRNPGLQVFGWNEAGEWELLTSDNLENPGKLKSIIQNLQEEGLLGFQEAT
jgi:hypothetical protein